MSTDENTQSPQTNETAPRVEASREEQVQQEAHRHWQTTVASLTAAAKIDVPGYGALDLAGFLASAPAAVAGNLGSVDRVTAGRPGSWEADLVRQLVGLPSLRMVSDNDTDTKE